MNTLIHIGFGNIVNKDKIIAIVSPDSAPIKRLVQHAKEDGSIVDVILTESNKVVLSALMPETIASRAIKE